MARWQPLLDSGLRTGVELREAWGRLTEEAARMLEYLGKEEEVGGGREEVQEARQVMVPDFRLELPATTATGLASPGIYLAPGQCATRLAELKFYCGKAHFRQGRRQRQFKRAVDLRVEEVRREYVERAGRGWTGCWGRIFLLKEFYLS